MMRVAETAHEVRAWVFRDVLLESHQYAPGPAAAAPVHAHADYQICLSLDFPGEYRYRGAAHPVPVGSLSVVHPGEVHSSRDPFDRAASTAYRVMYVPPARVEAVAAELVGGRVDLPFFADPILLDPGLKRDFFAVHEETARPDAELAAEVRLLTFLSRLVQRGGVAGSGAFGPRRERRAVRLVRAYLEERFSETVSLDQLVAVAGLSPFYLTRVFRHEVGMPPHAYQLAVRIARARKLLAAGWPPARVAVETGFADQAHFSRHFRRFVGTPPGHYGRG